MVLQVLRESLERMEKSLIHVIHIFVRMKDHVLQSLILLFGLFPILLVIVLTDGVESSVM
jgi:hypothetical protein